MSLKDYVLYQEEDDEPAKNNSWLSTIAVCWDPHQDDWLWWKRRRDAFKRQLARLVLVW
jgi:hypothetical protein